jgi:signal transduction histidine kinase
MKTTVPKKAADLIVNLPWGTHCCSFFKARTDLLDILVPYFRAGLLNNEFCLWVASKPIDVKDALRAMRSALPRFDSYLEKGQIEIHPYEDWYLKNGVFSSRRVLARWIDKYRQASAQGYAGLRLTGNAFRHEKTSWKKFVDYEEELDKTIGKYPIKAVCTYSLDLCQAYDVIDVVKNHGYALIKRGDWELIENSQRRRAEEIALDRAMNQLEQMVRSRTAELEAANQKLLSQIAERERAEDELRTSREELRDLAAYLQSVREEERTRIARELHDEVGQALTGIKLALETSIRERSDNAEAGLREALASANELIGRVRDISLELRPAMLDDLGLLAALRWHFDRYTAHLKVKVDFLNHKGLEGRRFPPEVETAVYRIVQEALTNVARHARVSRVEVGVEADESRVFIRVQDLGLGFDPEGLSDRGSSGLSGMRQRATMLGGWLTIDSSPGGGTLLTAELPLVNGSRR